ncbi:MAG: DUF493 domain-containing protein [Methylococcales bacterium]|jgi:uncharacterized protein|nr:DUF493 domain-containing protein [Methylococcales bacterium]MBT7411218.1 DUF493 domain-containing protein [Methylococcales bacterium]
MNNSNSDDETLLEFPCEFSVKAMGLTSEQFENTIVCIVRKHAADFGEAAVKNRPSKNGKYQSISITITAQSKQQLDNIYQDLTLCPDVIYAL